MIIRTLINAFRLITLYAVTTTANSGSSATATTTITANIVPAASFSVTAPIILNRQTSNPAPRSNVSQEQNISKPTFTNSAMLRTTDTNNPARFRINSNQNLIYDVSMPSHISASNNKRKIKAYISHTLDADARLNINQGYELEISGSLKDDAEKKNGTYHGDIDITVNYN